MTNEKLLELLNDLSFEEKVGQLTLLQASSCIEGTPVPFGPLVDLKVSPEQMSLCGLFGCNVPPVASKYANMVREMTQNHPHHIPPLMCRDVIHGFRTIFPVTNGLGCTFDEKYFYEMGRISAIEGAACGLHLTIGPMMDVANDPRWGRVVEVPSESSTHVAAMSAATVKGFRGTDIKNKDSLATCAKHFAAYGLVNAGQEYAAIDVSKTELFNKYLPPFKASFDAGCDSVMTAFVSVDRIPCVCNSYLQNYILREKWGYNVMSMSDYDNIRELMNHGMADDLKDCAELAINGGMDVDFLSLAYLTQLKELVKEGRVSMKTIDSAVYRVLKIKNDLGLFESPVKNDSDEYANSVCFTEKHKKASLEAALRSCVLLKNNGVLPLKEGVKVALKGDHVDEHDILGAWAVDGIRPDTETVGEAFKREERIIITDEKDADVILYFTGEFKHETGEAASKAHLYLKDEQIAELKRLHSLNKPIVTVLFLSRALILTDILPYCDAVLNAWFPGSMGAEAIRILLMGDMSPSGHLSMTFAKSMGQLPVFHDILTTCRPFGSRGKGRAFTNAYLDEDNEPLFPFGFGLSYTSFEITDTHVCGKNIEVTVKNTGAYNGETVLQLYGRVKKASVIRPLRTLISWQRIALKKGEEKIITIPMHLERLKLYDANYNEVDIKGECELYLGFDSDAKLKLSAMIE